MSDEANRAAERQERIAELERRLHSARPSGVKAWVAALCIAGTGVLAWLDRADLAYFFSAKEPITLGAEGDYRLGAIEPNRYVQLHGVPTRRAMYADEGGADTVIVGLRDSPFMVKRHALPGEERQPGKAPPPPSQTPFGIRGRLLSRAQAERYDRAFDEFQRWGELRANDGQLYLIAEGERPGGDVGLAVLMAVLLGFAALNGFFLVRAVRHRLRRPSS